MTVANGNIGFRFRTQTIPRQSGPEEKRVTQRKKFVHMKAVDGRRNDGKEERDEMNNKRLLVEN